jgi:hypothetical protein
VLLRVSSVANPVICTTLSVPSAYPSAHNLPHGDTRTALTLCSADLELLVVEFVVVVPNVERRSSSNTSGDTTVMNLAPRSRASIFRVALSPARDRAKTYADPVLAPRTIHARVASMHVKRTRAELTLRKSFADAMHVQRTAVSALFIDDDDVDVDVDVNASSRVPAPSASGDMASSTEVDARFCNSVDNRMLNRFRITTGASRHNESRLDGIVGAIGRAARIGATARSLSKRASVGRRRWRRCERFVTSCFSSRKAS